MITLDSANPPVGIWFVGLGEKLDFMGCLQRAGATEFHFDFRFRYHKDDEVFDSEDVKHWYHMDSRDRTEDEMLAVCRGVVLELCAAAEKLESVPPQMTEMLYRNYQDFHHFFREFQNQPWAFSKIASPEDEEKYGLSSGRSAKE